jgi:hypothetical protein
MIIIVLYYNTDKGTQNYNNLLHRKKIVDINSCSKGEMIKVQGVRYSTLKCKKQVMPLFIIHPRRSKWNFIQVAAGKSKAICNRSRQEFCSQIWNNISLFERNPLAIKR